MMHLFFLSGERRQAPGPELGFVDVRDREQNLIAINCKEDFAVERKTPLYEKHLEAGGRMVPFAGYLLPVQYRDVMEEHMAVRTAAGLFDVSHMGEVCISGPDALACIQSLFTNDFTNMTDGRVRYTLLCNGSGGIADDMVVYRNAADRYMIVVNAANREKDVAFIRSYLDGEIRSKDGEGEIPETDISNKLRKQYLEGGIRLEDISDSLAQLALQGPLSGKILEKLAPIEKLPAKYYTFCEHVDVSGIDCLISQTGYTGEKGYELYCRAEDGPGLWDILLEVGEVDGLIPCGLGARDTLRLEAGMPLYGHEMNDDVSPLETGLSTAVKMEKPDFIGRKGILDRGHPTLSRVGLKVLGRGIAREHCPVRLAGEWVGETTSGTYCPFLKGAFAMALLKSESSGVGTKVEIEVRGRNIEAEIVPLPFYLRGENK